MPHRPRTARVAPRRLERLVASLDDADALDRQAARVGDWEDLYEQAFDQSVAGVLTAGLEAIAFPVPPAVLEPARQRIAVDRLWHRRLEDAVHAVVEALAEDDLRVVVLKGVLLSERLYPDPRVRPANDVDLLAVAADFDRVTRTLGRIGYRAGDPENQPQHLVFHGAADVVVELHPAASWGMGTELGAGELLARAVRYRTARGAAAWILAPEDELIYLGVHAARHRFRRLLWLYDLKLFVARHDELDWATIRARTRSAGTFQALSTACEVLRRRLGGLAPGTGQSPPRSLRARLTAALLARERDPLTVLFAYPGIGEHLYLALLSDQLGPGLRHWFGFLARRIAGRLGGGALLHRGVRPRGGSGGSSQW